MPMPPSISDHGLTQLASGEVDGQPPRVDVVFVHGLFGHPYHTWSTPAPGQPRKRQRLLSSRKESSDPSSHKDGEPPNEIFWLQDILPQALPNARIFTWGYDVRVAKFLSPSSSLSVKQHAETLLSDLVGVRTNFRFRSSKVIFVAHSLGGIVVKKALSLSASSETATGEILRQTAGVCFLGTPHRGARVAYWGSLALDLYKIFGGQPNTNVMETLQENSENLQYITQEFSKLLTRKSFNVYSFREEYPYHGVMIVDDYSSTIGDGMEECSTIPSNHRDMTKFSSAEDTGFRRVLAILEYWQSEWHLRRENYCLSSITRTELSARIDDIEAPYESTYRWLLRDKSEFHQWLDDRSNNIFWISGIPGCGKSTAMKYVMRHPLTRKILTMWDSRDWVVAGFFFHELGTQVQKSVGGLYAEILFRILRVHRSLLAEYVEPIYQTKCEALASSSGYEGPIGDENRYVVWSDAELRDLLLACVRQTTIPVNACLFIDALDEHSGDHRQVLSFLQSLVSEASSKQVRIKLCLASRPENVFKDAFRSCQGFAMHEKTQEDIEAYVYGMMAAELSRAQRTEPEPELQSLVREVVESARGVFLWVNLMVPELIEGISEGDNVEELRSALYAIPPNLGDIYRRALSRKVRRTFSKDLQMKQAYERWIIFRVALAARPNFPLEAFMRIAAFNVALDTQDASMPPPAAPSSSLPEVIRRLTVRTAGLIDTLLDRTHNRLAIRFIHQTVEEFVRTPEATAILSEGLPEKFLQDGDYFLDRYSILTNPRFGLADLESCDSVASTRVIKNLPKSELQRFHKTLRHTPLPVALESLWRSRPPRLSAAGSPLGAMTEADYGKMVIYTFWLKQYPLSTLLGSSDAYTSPNGSRLLCTAMWCRLLQDPPFALPQSSSGTDIFVDVLQTGVNPDASFNGKTILEHLLDRIMLGSASQKGLLEMTGSLLEAGADPNQMTQFWDGASPLHVAAKVGALKLVEQLLDHGADPDKTDAHGRTYRDYFPEDFKAPSVPDISFSVPPMIVVSEWES